jgi:hypothetical protein
VLAATLSLAACEDCSDRQQLDLRTEAELDRVLSTQYATTYDAGVARLAALELELAPVLEVTPARLAELADATTVDTSREFTVRVLVRDRARAHELLSTLLARHLEVVDVLETEDGLQVDVSLSDPAAVKPEAYPPWTPAAPDGVPCLAACRERTARIVEKRALLTDFATRLERLRQLNKVKRNVDEYVAREPTAPVIALLHQAVSRHFPAGTRIHFNSSIRRAAGVVVCNAGLSLDRCRDTFDGGTCAMAEGCGAGPCTVPERCGVVVYP